ncbi:zinc finger MYND domain-containing protein 10-like [Mya arenaria]|uniref:zinc finger MYND domain-containing protein 10-like n=1 Tax=Mya arenaria TaxID=6604 RepID=UPI0022E22CED|nr:zinc finger MYND domain-containing protein 10-like [Mya arenaria]
MSAEGGGQVLLPVEAEAAVESLKQFPLKEIGGPKWSVQHEVLEKLNMQAILNASAQEDEFVKDYLITCDKLSLLIYDLLATEVWKEKVFSEILDTEDFDPKTTFPLYMVLYHEATVINLLETTMFYREVCEAAEDCVLDLVDYCYRKLTQLIARSEESEEEKDEEVDVSQDVSKMVHASNLQELEKQDRKLNFEICIKAVSLLRYIVDHLEGLPLSVMTRLLNTHDIPQLLVQLIGTPPWSHRKDGKQYKYIDGKWVQVDFADSLKLTKIEGQVWLSIFQLLMSTACQQKYELDTYRKNTILKLRSFLTEPMLDQIPMLGELQRYLEHLSMMDPPAPRREVILEQVPEVRDYILHSNEGKWKKIAKKQIKLFFDPSTSDLKMQAKRWADTYNFDVMEGLLSEPPKCAKCGEDASKRCSRCQNEWYCGRECQVTHWQKHKQACDLMFDSLKKLKEHEQAKG